MLPELPIAIIKLSMGFDFFPWNRRFPFVYISNNLMTMLNDSFIKFQNCEISIQSVIRLRGVFVRDSTCVFTYCLQLGKMLPFRLKAFVNTRAYGVYTRKWGSSMIMPKTQRVSNKIFERTQRRFYFIHIRNTIILTPQLHH